MNKEWAEKNKQMQTLASKKDTFDEGIKLLIELRTDIFNRITELVKENPADDFYKMPFKGAEGYHSKTLAYSIWHIFRIEDIVANTLIRNMDEVLFSMGYDKTTGSDIITTGNELEGDAIVEFSKKLDVNVLYEYSKDVMENTNELLMALTFHDMKRTFTEKDKERIANKGVVSDDENAVWLIDYWCNKNLLGLLKMPFSRHWIMHVEAMNRINDKISRQEKRTK